MIAAGIERRSGPRVVLAVWLMVAIDLVLTVVTYARLPARELYNVS